MASTHYAVRAAQTQTHEDVPMMKLPCNVIYVAMSALYTAALFGLDKPIVSLMSAIAYATLAFSKHR